MKCMVISFVENVRVYVPSFGEKNEISQLEVTYNWGSKPW